MSQGNASVTQLLLGAGVASGVLLHQFFRTFELDRYPFSILGFFWGVTFVIAFALRYGVTGYGSFLSALGLAWVTTACAILSLWANILVYRALFHPLRKFPGPFGAKLTKFWALREVVRSKIKWYKVLGELHEQYGDYVRVGPRELAIFDVNAIKPILGLGSKARKGPFYGALEESLHTTRDHDFHRKRRKIWDMAFKETMRDYGSTIEDFTDAFLARLERSVGQNILVNQVCIYYSYDVMSSLAFGTSTKFLEGGATDVANKILSNMEEGIAAVGAFLHVPWLLTILETVSFAGPMMEMNRWAADGVEKRRQIKNPRPDIMGHLLEHTEDTPTGRKLLNADSRVIIGAGSDTTASALSALFILLAARPTLQERLRVEVTKSFEDGTYTCATPQPLLDSIITETLRLYPPVTFCPQRVTPAEGMTIGGVKIPPDTIVSIATHSIQRDPRYFVKPLEFIPERWTTQPELILNKDAYMPFSTGPYNCPGRTLALLELRSLISRTVHTHAITFDPHFRTIPEFEEAIFFRDIKDHFTAGMPKCEVRFRRICDRDRGRDREEEGGVGG